MNALSMLFVAMLASVAAAHAEWPARAARNWPTTSPSTTASVVCCRRT